MARIGFWITGFSDDPRDRLPFVLPDFPVTFPVYATVQQGFDFVWRWSSMELDFSVDIDDGATVISSSGSIGSANSPVPISSEQDIGCHGFLIQAWTATLPNASVLGTLILDSYEPATNRFIFILDLQITNASGTITTVNTGGAAGPSISIFGNSVPTWVSAGSTASGTISVGVFAYYPYRDHLGNNPIWDVLTGAQLISPLPTDAG